MIYSPPDNSNTEYVEIPLGESGSSPKSIEELKRLRRDKHIPENDPITIPVGPKVDRSYEFLENTPAYKADHDQPQEKELVTAPSQKTKAQPECPPPNRGIKGLFSKSKPAT